MKILRKIKNLFIADKWETVYSNNKLYTYGGNPTVTAIQVDRTKNIYRCIVFSAGRRTLIDVTEICLADSEAQEVCKREEITW
jgi:hypothetical protein